MHALAIYGYDCFDAGTQYDPRECFYGNSKAVLDLNDFSLHYLESF